MSDQNDRELNIIIRLRADLDKAIADIKKGLGDVHEEGAKTEGTLGKINAVLSKFGISLSGILGLTALAAGVKKLFGVIAAGADEAGVARQKVAALDMALRSVGGSASAELPRLQVLADEYRRLGFTLDDFVESDRTFAQRMLSSEDRMRAMTVAVRLAALENISLESASMQVGQAIQGMVRSYGALGQMLGSTRNELNMFGDESKNLDVIFKSSERYSDVAQRMGSVKKELSALNRELLKLFGTSLAAQIWNGFKQLYANILEGAISTIKSIRRATGGDSDESPKERVQRELSEVQKAYNEAAALKTTGRVLGSSLSSAPFGGPYAVPGFLEASNEKKLAGLKKERERLLRELADIDRSEQKKAALEEAERQRQQELDRIAQIKRMMELQQFAEADELLRNAERQAQIRHDIAKNQHDQSLNASKVLAEDLFNQESTGNNKLLGERLQQVETFWRQQWADEKAQIENNAAQRTTLLKSVRAKLVTILAPSAGDAEAAGTWADKFIRQQASPFDMWNEGKLKLPKGDLEDFNVLLKQAQQLQDEVTDSSRQLSDAQLRYGDSLRSGINQQISEYNKALEDAYTAEKRNLELKKASGELNNRDFDMQDIKLRKQFADRYLNEITLLKQRRAAIASNKDATYEERIEAIELGEQIVELRQKYDALIPSLEEIAAKSDNIFIGMRLGMQRIQNKIKSFAQISADSIEIVGTRLGDGFYNAFEGIINGTKSVANAFREMTVSILQDMAKLFAEQAAMQFVSGLIGGMFNALGTSVGKNAGQSVFQSNGSFGFSVGQGLPGKAEGGIMPGPITADDRYPVMVRGGEGFIRPEAVAWIGGPRAIHAINRMIVPQDIISKMLANLPSEPSIPRFNFAGGGVAAALSSSGTGGGAVPVVVSNTVAIGDAEISRIAASTESRKGVMAAIAANPRQVRQILGLS